MTGLRRSGLNLRHSNDVVDEDEICVGTHDWFATVRGKVGWADAEFRYENYTDGTRTVLEGEVGNWETMFGWTAGGGVGIALGDVASLKAEYLYADFGDLDYNGGFSGKVDVDTHMARGGVLFHF